MRSLSGNDWNQRALASGASSSRLWVGAWSMIARCYQVAPVGGADITEEWS